MARTHGRIKVEVWDVGSEFRLLSVEAQWAYEMLVSQPWVTMCGTLLYAPKKWAKLASGLSGERLEAAIRELEQAWYVIVDRDSDELLIRTFIKHDTPWRLPNLIVAARAQFRVIESESIRDYLAQRHEWIVDDSMDANAVRTYEERRASEHASERTLPMDVGDAHPDVHSNPRAIAGARVREGQEKVLSRGSLPAAVDQDQEPSKAGLATSGEPDESRETAAAGEADELAAAIQALPGFDERSWTQVGPLVEAVGAEAAREVLAEAKRRRNVENPVGLFKQLLEIRRRELVRAQVEASISESAETAKPKLEKLRDDPEAYVRELGWKLPGDVLDEALKGLLPDDEGRRFELANLAADLRHESSAA